MYMNASDTPFVIMIRICESNFYGHLQIPKHLTPILVNSGKNNSVSSVFLKKH